VELFVPLGAVDDCGTSFGVNTVAAPRDGTPTLERWAAYIFEAAQRFGRPEAWVRAVMQAESRGVADATSPAGAMGLMQDYAGDICRAAGAVWARCECLRRTRQHHLY
jgi:hypothetical protein